MNGSARWNLTSGQVGSKPRAPEARPEVGLHRRAAARPAPPAPLFGHRHRPADLPSWAIDAHPDLPACAGCGRCCHLLVELRPGDAVPEELVVVREGLRCLDQHADGRCVALDPVTKLCTIYAIRPQTCRDFARGSALCRQILGRAAR